MELIENKTSLYGIEDKLTSTRKAGNTIYKTAIGILNSNNSNQTELFKKQ